MNPEISVIVPVYNVEKTLERCIQSIIRQTFRDFEIILVNDGSTDDSGHLCDEYAQKCTNIRAIHKENEGLGPTRNLGIRIAAGNYIYHCDSDDWLKPELLQNAYQAITATNADVVVFGYDIFTEYDNTFIPFDSIIISAAVYTTAEAVRKEFVKQYYNSYVVQSACNRLYRKSFLLDNNLFFPSIRRSQDRLYSLLLFDCLSRLTTLEEAYYCYIIEPGKYKGQSFMEMIAIYLSVFDTTKEMFLKWGLFTSIEEEKLINNVCEQIANYSAHAFANKFRLQWLENSRLLIENERVRNLFSQYKNNKKSRFMVCFCLGVRIRSQRLLLEVSKIVQRKVSC